MPGREPRAESRGRALTGSLLHSALLVALLLACSPEARRVRDGGPGADPNNKDLVASRPVNPQAADTTLWPGAAPAPVERLAAGTMAPPVAVTPARSPRPGAERPVTSRTPATRAEQRTFDRGTAADPRRQTGGGRGAGARDSGAADSARARPPRP
jgi:hypothetical protein